jgi:hypothetical protein
MRHRLLDRQAEQVPRELLTLVPVGTDRREEGIERGPGLGLTRRAVIRRVQTRAAGAWSSRPPYAIEPLLNSPATLTRLSSRRRHPWQPPPIGSYSMLINKSAYQLSWREAIAKNTPRCRSSTLGFPPISGQVLKQLLLCLSGTAHTGWG